MHSAQNEASSIPENPFFHRGPIRNHRYFFGRTAETRRALQMLRNGQCVSIVGPRRIGRTSFLFHLCDPQVQERYLLGEEYLFVYIDCQGMGNLDKPLFYQRVLERTQRALAERGKTDRLTESISNLGAQGVQAASTPSTQRTPDLEHLIELRRVLTTRFDEGEIRTLCFELGIDYHDLPGEGKANKARELVAYLERHGRIAELVRAGERLRPAISWCGKEAGFAIQSQSLSPGSLLADFDKLRRVITTIRKKGYKPIFLFDEFEIAAQNNNLDQSLFSDLRSLVPTVIYVTASQDSLYDLTYTDRSVLSSPFFNIFWEIRLGFLRHREAEEMVRGLLRMTGREDLFTKEDLAFIFEICGYYPFFLQLACYHIFEQKSERRASAAADYERVRLQYGEDAEPHFRYAWKNLDAAEQQAVRLVCEGKVGQLDDEQKRRLERKCLLYKDAFFSSVFAEFVRRQMAETRAGKEGEAKIQRIPVFLSYAREDEERVEHLYQKLSDEGFKPWMDKKDILPGERWRTCVQRAIRASDFFLVCLSANSVTKRGYVQKEIRGALDICQEMLDSDIYLIPIRLEDCDVPESLRAFQWVNLYENDGWAQLMRAIQVGMERRM